MKMNLMCTGILLAAVNQLAFSQNVHTDRYYSVAASVGVVTVTQATYAFESRYMSSNYTPGFSGGVEFSYGNFVLANPTYLRFSVEYKYTHMSTAEPGVQNRYSQMRLRQHTGIFWAKAKVPSDISPIVRVGFGLANFNYEEDFGDIQDNASTCYWSPALGFGGALDIVLTRNIMVAPHVDVTIILLSRSLESKRGLARGTVGKFLTPSYGIRIETLIF